MHIKNTVVSVLMFCLLGMMTSCVKYYDLVKSEFPQGGRLQDQSTITAQYCRSATVYHQFETQAAFSVLWLSDAVRTAYVDVYCEKRGMPREEKEQMLTRQLEENSHWLSMYILADVRDKTFASLSDPNALWTVASKIDKDKKLVPESIKEVDLEPEYRTFFGKRFDSFKVAYLIKFSVEPSTVQKLSTWNFSVLRCILRSTQKECEISWDKKDILTTKQARRDEDFYWC